MKQLEQQLKQTETLILERIHKLMSAVSDFASKEQADLDSVKATLTTVATGVVALDDAIKALQAQVAAGGSLSAADQALLDGIVSSSDALAAQAKAIDTTIPVVVPPAVL